MIATTGYLLLLVLMGWLLLGPFQRELSGLERIGLAYGVGAGLFTLASFLSMLVGSPLWMAMGGLFALALIGIGRQRLAQRDGMGPTGKSCALDLSPWQILLVGMIAATVVFAFVVATYPAPFAWDALATWLLKGKLIAAKGSLDLAGLADAPSYPLNIPLQAAGLFWLGGDFVQAIFPFYLLSLILVFYANLRKWLSPIPALVCTLCLSVTPYLIGQSVIGYANVPFAFYYVGSALYLFRYLQEKKQTWLILSGLLIGLAGWTRSEASLYLAINLIVLAVFSGASRNAVRSLAIYVSLFAILWAPWNIYWRLAGYPDYLGSGLGILKEMASGQVGFDHIQVTLGYFWESATTFSKWGLVWLAFPLALLVARRRIGQFAPLIALIVLNGLGLVFLYYAAGTDLNLTMSRWLETGFDRLALQWNPLILFLLGAVLKDYRPVEDVMENLRNRIDVYLILLLLFSLFAIGPLLAPGYFWGAHDGRHSVYFLFEFDRVIQDGIFYPRWLPDFTFGYGYPFFNIYGPGAFYVGEALHLAGFDLVTATKIVFALAILLSGPTMFGFVKRLTGSSQAAFLSGLAYVYIPYHIADIYVRAALAESVALVFLPLTLWGFYETVNRPNRKTIVATAMAYGAMTFAHNGIALLFTPILGIWVLFLIIGEMRKDTGETQISISGGLRARLVALIRLGLPSLAALALGMGLVSIFLIPLALEYPYVRVDQWTANYYDYSNHFVELFQLFSPFWGFGISSPGPHDGMSFQLGVVPVLLAIFSILAIVKNPKGTRRLWLFFMGMTCVVILLMFGFSLPIWEALRLVTFAQFPWRLLTLTMISLAVPAGAIVLTQESDHDRQGLSLPTLLLGALMVLGGFPYLTAQMQLEAKEGPVGVLGLFRFQQSAGEMTGSTAWVEEIPTWSPMADVYFAGKRVKSKIDYTDIDPDKLWIGVLPNFIGLRTNGERIAYNAKEDNLPITFNTFYYPGWRAYLVKPWSTDIIRELPIQVVGELGRIQVHVPKGEDQWLMLRFDDTLPRLVGAWISGLCILLMLGLLIWDVRDKRRSGGPTNG